MRISASSGDTNSGGGDLFMTRSCSVLLICLNLDYMSCNLKTRRRQINHMWVTEMDDRKKIMKRGNNWNKSEHWMVCFTKKTQDVIQTGIDCSKRSDMNLLRRQSMSFFLYICMVNKGRWQRKFEVKQCGKTIKSERTLVWWTS